jgi:hypothetical protein
MRIFDLIYYLSNKAYIKGNKEKSGAFFISSLWFSLLQLMWIIIIIYLVEIYLLETQFEWIDNIYNFAFVLVLIVVSNNVYLNIGKRKEKIMNNFKIPEKRETYYWIIIIVFFFVRFVIAGRMAFLKKELFN